MSFGIADWVGGPSLMAATAMAVSSPEWMVHFEPAALLTTSATAFAAWAGAPRVAYGMGWAILGMCLGYIDTLAAMASMTIASPIPRVVQWATRIAALLYGVLGATGWTSAALLVPWLTALAASLTMRTVFPDKKAVAA